MTAGERALARIAFGARIDFGRVRIRRGAGFNPAAGIAFASRNTAITLGRTIYFSSRYRPDFSLADARDQALLIHELTHVWQYRRLGVGAFLLRYGRELAACRFRPRALYFYVPGETRFEGARLEAQAQMVGDHFCALLDGDAAAAGRLAGNLAGTGFYGL